MILFFSTESVQLRIGMMIVSKGGQHFHFDIQADFLHISVWCKWSNGAVIWLTFSLSKAWCDVRILQ